jgi:transposase
VDGYDGRQIVGIDLHRRRSVIVRMTETGEQLETVRIDNDPLALGLEIAKAGEAPDVVLEATYGWYWAVDVLQDAGAVVHLAHPLGVKGFAYRRVKNDVRDASDLADLLRMGRLPEAWIAPASVRELREVVRHRAKLVALRTGLKAQVHAVLAKQGVTVPMTDLFGVAGGQLLDELRLDPAYNARVVSLRRLIEALDFEIDNAGRRTAAKLATHPGYRAVQTIDGVGPILAAVFVAEIGDVTRFHRPEQLCSWAGLTPGTANPIPPCTAHGSPNKATRCCGGPPSRPSSGYAADRWERRGSVSVNDAEPIFPRSPLHESSSPWCSTGYATGTSVA